MPGPAEQPPSGLILDFFAGTQHRPVTASEVASETGYPTQATRTQLGKLVSRGLLNSRELDGTQVWWLPGPARGDAERAEATPTGTKPEDARQTPAGRRRLIDQHRQLAQFVTRVNVTDDLDEILRLITEEARELVGAHQSVTSRTVNLNWEQAINAVSLSEKYAEFREYDTEPDGSGIYALVCERNEPMRMTQAELESHPAWKAFGDDAEEHPPMRGWLAVPIVGPEGENRGLIQLSDKYQGQFTEADEAILVQLANAASAAIENAQLYDELRDSEERYRTLFDSMAEGYCIFERVDAGQAEGTEFRYVEGNSTFESLTGLADVTGNTLREKRPGEYGEWAEPIETVVQTGETNSFQRELDPDGCVLQCHAFPIGDGATGQVGMTVQDITERVEYEQRLENSNERLEQFAYAASHDLQEPLRMVSSYVQLIESRYADDLDEAGREYIEFAVDGADRMRDMIDALLQYSRVDTQGDSFEPVDLETVVDDVLVDLQVKVEEEDAEISVDDLPSVEGDGDQLRQVFQNLLDNAIEYSDDAPTVRVSAERRDDRWLVSVSDDGIGIDPAKQDRIFQVFQSLHARGEHEGTGIGLALCQRIVERHGGDIWVDSEPGEGSTFSFTVRPLPGQ